MKNKTLPFWKIVSSGNIFMIRKFFLFRFEHGLPFLSQNVNEYKKIVFDRKILFKIVTFLEGSAESWKVDLFGNIKALRFFFCFCGEKFSYLLKKKKIIPITCFHLNGNFLNKLETNNALPLTYKILNSIFDTKSSRLILPIKNLTGYGGYTRYKKYEMEIDTQRTIEAFKNVLSRAYPENTLENSFLNSDKLSFNNFLKTYTSTEFILDHYIFFSKAFGLLSFF